MYSISFGEMVGLTIRTLPQFAKYFFREHRHIPISASKLHKQLERGDNLRLFDFRDAPTFEELGHLPGAVNIPYEEFPDRFNEIEHGTPIVVICYMGFINRAVAQRLIELGHRNVYCLTEGMQSWYKAGFATSVDE